MIPPPNPYIDVVTTEEFPHGLRCAVCSVLIPPGEEYAVRVASRLWDGTPVGLCTCLTCEDVSEFSDRLPEGIDPRLN